MLSRSPALTLPDGFLFGASAGNGSDHHWREDMDLLVDLGFTDYRFCLDRARIEPAPGQFSKSAIAHCRSMVEGAIERGLRPMVTLQHGTVPGWFAEQGGWKDPAAVDGFARYATATAPIIGSGVRHVCTIDEPNAAEGPPTALIQAHRRATDALKEISPTLQAGWSVTHRAPHAEVFIKEARRDDWVGAQVCTRTPVGSNDPAALGHALRRTAELAPGVPVIVTENGIATDDDKRRVAHTARGLWDLAAAIAGGADIRGYLHRSAPERASHQPYGLISVDPMTSARRPRPSAAWLGSIARSRTLPYGGL